MYTNIDSMPRFLLFITLPVIIASLTQSIANAQLFPWEEPVIEQPLPPPPPESNRCVGDGLQVCRCYCRIDFTQCQDNQVSYSSVPLCKAPWADTKCTALAYYQTQSTDAASCTANEGQPCGGYIRPGDAGNDLLGQPVAGKLLGCTMVAIPTPSR